MAPEIKRGSSTTRVGEELHIEHVERGALRKAVLPVNAELETVVGPMAALVAERNLPQLRAGAEIHVRYGVLDRLAIYELTLRKREPPSDAGTLEVQVAPDQWLVRQFAKPVSLFFDDAGVFVGMRGRALPASGEPEKRKPMEVDARVRVRESGPCSAEPALHLPSQ